MKYLGDVRYFLGLEIDRSAAGFYLSQKKYITVLLKEHGLTSTTLLKVPLDAHLKVSPGQGQILCTTSLSPITWQAHLSFCHKARYHF